MTNLIPCSHCMDISHMSFKFSNVIETEKRVFFINKSRIKDKLITTFSRTLYNVDPLVLALSDDETTGASSIGS